MNHLRVSVPSSSANLGPGFDSLGLALSLYHRLDVWEHPGESGFEVNLKGEGAQSLNADGTNPVCEAMLSAFDACSYSHGHIRIDSDSEIPVSRGLGSSASATLAGLTAGLLLAAEGVDRHRLLELGVAMEGHADNVAPSLFGGFTVVCRSEDRATECVQLDPPAALQVTVSVPELSMSTADSRLLLPDAVPFATAVQNQARAALLTAAIATGNLSVLQVAMEDQLHQPYREPHIAGFADVCAAALGAGALGAALSGAGPSVIALTSGKVDAVGDAMRKAWSRHGISSQVLHPAIDRRGLTWSSEANQKEGI